MGVGRGQGGLAPLDFDIFSKEGCFLSFEWEKKQILPLFGLPLEKILPTPMGIAIHSC